MILYIYITLTFLNANILAALNFLCTQYHSEHEADFKLCCLNRTYQERNISHIGS